MSWHKETTDLAQTNLISSQMNRNYVVSVLGEWEEDLFIYTHKLSQFPDDKSSQIPEETAGDLYFLFAAVEPLQFKNKSLTFKLPLAGALGDTSLPQLFLCDIRDLSHL